MPTTDILSTILFGYWNRLNSLLNNCYSYLATNINCLLYLYSVVYTDIYNFNVVESRQMTMFEMLNYYILNIIITIIYRLLAYSWRCCLPSIFGLLLLNR